MQQLNLKIYDDYGVDDSALNCMLRYLDPDGSNKVYAERDLEDACLAAKAAIGSLGSDFRSIEERTWKLVGFLNSASQNPSINKKYPDLIVESLFHNTIVKKYLDLAFVKLSKEDPFFKGEELNRTILIVSVVSFFVFNDPSGFILKAPSEIKSDILNLKAKLDEQGIMKSELATRLHPLFIEKSNQETAPGTSPLPTINSISLAAGPFYVPSPEPHETVIPKPTKWNAFVSLATEMARKKSSSKPLDESFVMVDDDGDEWIDVAVGIKSRQIEKIKVRVERIIDVFLDLALKSIRDSETKAWLSVELEKGIENPKKYLMERSTLGISPIVSAEINKEIDKYYLSFQTYITKFLNVHLDRYFGDTVVLKDKIKSLIFSFFKILKKPDLFKSQFDMFIDGLPWLLNALMPIIKEEYLPKFIESQFFNEGAAITPKQKALILSSSKGLTSFLCDFAAEWNIAGRNFKDITSKVYARKKVSPQEISEKVWGLLGSIIEKEFHPAGARFQPATSETDNCLEFAGKTALFHAFNKLSFSALAFNALERFLEDMDLDNLETAVPNLEFADASDEAFSKAIGFQFGFIGALLIDMLPLDSILRSGLIKLVEFYEKKIGVFVQKALNNLSTSSSSVRPALILYHLLVKEENGSFSVGLNPFEPKISNRDFRKEIFQKIKPLIKMDFFGGSLVSWTMGSKIDESIKEIINLFISILEDEEAVRLGLYTQLEYLNKQ